MKQKLPMGRYLKVEENNVKFVLSKLFIIIWKLEIIS